MKRDGANRNRNRVLGAAAIVGALALSAASSGGPAQAEPHHHSVVGHVYVNDNTSGTNTVAGFARHEDGSLTPLSGSPFAVGGAGLGKGLASQGALQESRDGRFLLAADAGSNQISVLRIHEDGSLTPVPHSPFSSGGVQPVSIAVHDHLVYVANTGAGGANYTGFILGHDGDLSPLPGSTVAVPDGSGLGDVLFNDEGTRLVGVRVAPSQIDSFVVDHGLLVGAPGSPYAAQTAGPFGSDFRKSHPDQLFVSNAHAGALAGTVSAFLDGDDGVLTSIGNSPYADDQTAPCWLKVSPDSRFVFAVNTASGSISRYAIADDGALSLLGSTPFRGTGVVPTDPSFDRSGRFFYVTDGAGEVSAFTVADGVPSEIPSSPVALPAGATPAGMVVTSLR